MTAWLATGCSCSETIIGDASSTDDGPDLTIECYAPVDGDTLTEEDDVSPTTPGIQVEVRCTVRGCGGIIMLHVADEDGSSPRDYTMPYDGSGEVVFSPVSLEGDPADDPTSYTFQVFCDGGEVESNVIGVDVVAP
jgi:hypothetical protein